jgi:hypothetical protein
VADRCPFIDHLPSCAPVNSPSGCSAVEEYFVQVLSIVAMPVSLRVQAGHYTAMAQPSVIPPVEQTLSDATQQRVFASGSGGGGHTPTLEKSRHCVSRTVGSWLSEGLGLATRLPKVWIGLSLELRPVHSGPQGQSISAAALCTPGDSSLLFSERRVF